MTNARILVVQDETALAEGMQNLLLHAKYDIPAVVPSGEEVVKRTRQLRPDLVLIDIKENHALEAVAIAKHIVSLFYIPVLCIAAREDRECLELSIIDEPIMCLRKPYDDDELLTCIRIILQAHHFFRRRLNEVVKEKEEQFRDSFDSAPIGKALVGLDGRLLKVNKALSKLSGYDEQQLTRMKFQDIIQVDSGETESDLLQEILTNEMRPRQKEGRFKHRLGHDLYVLLNFSLVGTIHRNIILQVLDITTRKQSEESLRKSEKRYRKLVEATTSYIYTVEVENGAPRSTRHEQGCVFVTGYNHEEYETNPQLWYQIVFDGDRKEVMNQAAAILAGKSITPIEHRIIHKDGSIRWVRNTPVPHYDDQGRLVSYDGLITNITEERHLKDQLHQAQKIEVIGQLAGGIAHDFNNILTAIIGYCTILEMKTLEGSPLKQDIDYILNAAERAAKLTERLLAFSRKQASNPEPVNINDIVKRVEKLLSRVIGEDIQLEYSFSNASMTTMVDSWQLEQVLINLATNARDAMPHGGLLTIETGTAELNEDFIEQHGYGEVGVYASIIMTDTGMGMDDVTQKRIFEPFYTTKESGKGTGLGLAIVYGIVKQHKGYITVSSGLGKGSTFTIFLPIVDNVVEERKPAAVSHTPGKETVLLAEDDPDVRISTKALLENFGYTVIEATGGEDAINKFKEHQNSVDLLILDVVMPTKTGNEVYEEIRKVNPNIKALFTSGYTDEIVRQKGNLEKKAYFVSKPISPSLLSKKIREVLDA